MGRQIDCLTAAGPPRAYIADGFVCYGPRALCTLTVELPSGTIYVMTIGRTNESINKAEDAGRIDAQIRSTDALRRVLPTGLTGYL